MTFWKLSGRLTSGDQWMLLVVSCALETMYPWQPVCRCEDDTVQQTVGSVLHLLNDLSETSVFFYAAKTLPL